MEVTRYSIDEATPDEWDIVARKWKDKEFMEGQEKYKDLRTKMKEDEKKHSAIHNPPHYNQGTIECIEAIEAMLSDEEFIGYLRGNSTKYRWRFREKNGIEDVKKAEWYESRLKRFMEKHNVLGQEG